LLSSLEIFRGRCEELLGGRYAPGRRSSAIDTQISPLSSHRMIKRAESAVPAGVMTKVTSRALVWMSGKAPGR
jgi:hypothetical protein